jgi:DNA-binding response OmpR family regulator
MRIALLEDDSDQAQLVTLWLTDAGHEVTHFTAGDALLAELRHGRFDLVVLDWLVPGLSGIEVLKRMRGQQLDLPVLFLTQYDTEAKVVEALEAGADDYVAKPALRGVFVARVKALLRRSGADAPAEVEHGQYRTDTADRAVIVAGAPVVLTEREFELAKYLLARFGKVVTRAELLKNVWRIAAEGLETRTIDTHMSKLRKKLHLDGGHGIKLTSIYNHGYRLETVDPL